MTGPMRCLHLCTAYPISCVTSYGHSTKLAHHNMRYNSLRRIPLGIVAEPLPSPPEETLSACGCIINCIIVSFSIPPPARHSGRAPQR
jgi:hypothetical protein